MFISDESFDNDVTCVIYNCFKHQEETFLLERKVFSNDIISVINDVRVNNLINEINVVYMMKMIFFQFYVLLEHFEFIFIIIFTMFRIASH